MISQIILYIRQKSLAAKNALIIAFLISSAIASATDYYISSSGNDTNNGLSSSTPWKTIAKVNSAFSVVKPGDRILFNRGNVFTGQVTLTCSGSSLGKITLSAYGIGDIPVIQGNTEITSWTRFNGNIWVADCPQLGSTVTNFLINGKSQQIGRYPNSDATNKGYLTIKSHSGSTQLTSTSLESSPNWTGAEAVVRSARWVLDRVPIQLHQGNSLVFSKPTSCEIQDNFGFFIQNNLNTLDQSGEWYFDSTNKKMYLYWSVDPNSLNTQASAYSSIFIANNQSYFSIENIQFRGSVNTTVDINNSDNIDMKNITITESGTNAVYFRACNNVSFNYNKIINTNNNALIFELCENVLARYNEIRQTGMRSGMGLSSYGQYTGLYVSGNNNYFESNIIDSVGYISIHFSGNLVTIKNNYITNFCMTKDDGGGLYTWSDGKSLNSNRRLENNIILNGIGAGEGTNDPTYIAADGIYMDDRTNNVSILNNTVANCTRGIFIHNSNNISIIGNTLFNNKTQLLFVHSLIAPTYPITHCIIKDNILFSRLKSQVLASFRTLDNDIQNFGTFDNNYYCRPIEDDSTIYAEYIGNLGTISNFMDLAIWQTTFHYDLHSKKSPITISSITNIDDYIKFLYNPTNSSVTYNMDGKYYVDPRGTEYSSSFTLLPYTSTILMVNPNPLASSAKPFYVSSSIEETTPAVLEMNYDFSLANIIPAASSFYVKVNYIDRNITTVAISGAKVMLTLASPVVYGDNVTVGYTKTPTNPIQTNSGVEAESISSQPVTNNCLNIKKSKINIYPNPAHDFVNISIEDPTLAPEIIKIINLSGKIVFTDHMEEGRKNVQIPENLNKGIYIITLESGNLILYADKLIISK